jgi:hypothetical protein
MDWLAEAADKKKTGIEGLRSRPLLLGGDGCQLSGAILRGS